MRPPTSLLIKVTAVMLVGAGLVGVSACSSDTNASPSAGQSVASGAHLSAADFASSITEQGTVVVDVRTPAEFAAGHIPGAVNIDVESADFPQQISGLDTSATYALYCHSGRRSAAALQIMQGAGFRSVYDLAGGVQAWEADGGQLVTGA